jgi:serine protease
MMPNKQFRTFAVKSRALWLLPVLAGALVACPPAPTPPTPVQIGVQSASNTVQVAVGQSVQFSATGATGLTWKVNGIVGGNSSIGTISIGGTFTAPASVPNPSTVTIRAESKANPADFGEAQIVIIDSNGPGGIQGTITLPPGLLSASLRTKAAIPVAKPIKADWTLPHVAGEVLLVGADSSQLSARGLSAKSVTTEVSRLKVPAGTDERAFAEKIAAETGAQVQPNYIYRPLGTTTPNDPYFQTTNPNTQYHMPTIDIAGAWAVQTDGAMVAVLDSGAKFDHPDLQGRLLKGTDFCVDATNGCKDTDQDPSDFLTTGDGSGGHGTHTAGIIGAITNNSIGVAGIMQGGTVLVEKVLGPNSLDCVVNGVASKCTVASGTSSSIAAGIRDAVARGAKVINMSLGIVPGQSTAFDPDGAVSKAVSAADQADVLVVVAAGNVGTNSVGINYPANLPTVLAVGLVNNDGSATNFSEKGPEMDLVAPGLIANAKGVISTDIVGSSGYAYRGGTSEAAPQVAAVAGLMRAKNPSLSALQTRTILRTTAKKLGADSTIFGAGMLQAGAALREAAKNTTPAPTRTTIVIFADRLLNSGQYNNGNDPSSAKIQVEFEGTAGSSPYRFELGQNKAKLLAGTYRIVACVNKNANAQICDTGDLVVQQADLKYNGQAVLTVNLSFK